MKLLLLLAAVTACSPGAAALVDRVIHLYHSATGGWVGTGGSTGVDGQASGGQNVGGRIGSGTGGSIVVVQTGGDGAIAATGGRSSATGGALQATGGLVGTGGSSVCILRTCQLNGVDCPDPLAPLTIVNGNITQVITISNGCGGTINCGPECPAGQLCGGGGSGKCGTCRLTNEVCPSGMSCYSPPYSILDSNSRSVCDPNNSSNCLQASCSDPTHQLLYSCPSTKPIVMNTDCVPAVISGYRASSLSSYTTNQFQCCST